MKSIHSKFLWFCLSAIWPSIVFSQTIKPIKIDTANLPAAVTYQGQVKQAVKWTDKSGDNLILITETGIVKSNSINGSDDSWDAELFAYHFIIKQQATELTWKVYDFIKDCPVEVEASFIKNTLQVTDLDNNGLAEVWLMYKTACHGDISPCEMKVIMYEGGKKFAMRGQNKVKLAEKEYLGGEYKFDGAFTEGPAPFRDFALNLWNKHIMQVWGGN